MVTGEHTVGAKDELRVVELCDEQAAFAGRVLLGIGATVVRMEVEGVAWQGTPLDYVHFNAGKSVVQLPADVAAGRARELLADADAFITSFGQDELAPLGLDYAGLNAALPSLVYVSVRPFGLSGPRAGWLGTDLTIAALGGMAAMCGDPDEAPMRPPREQAYHLGGIHAAIGALLGVTARRRTGAGQLADISLEEVVASTLEYGALCYIHKGQTIRRDGSRYPHVPHKLFRTVDGYVAGGFGGSERMWTGLLEWLTSIGGPAELSDPRWADERTRWHERDRLFELVGDIVAGLTSAEVVREGSARGLPWAAVEPISSVVDNAQLASRRFFTEVTRPDGDPLVDAGWAFESPAMPRPARIDASDAWRVAATLPDGRWRHSVTAKRPAQPAAPLAEGRHPGGTVQAPALDGLRVLDLTWVLAGPYATRVLADHGATVIKVESRHRPDPTRYATAMRFSPRDDGDPDTSGYFANYSRNKKSILLNLKHPDARAVALDVAASCDVVIENFSAGVLERLGLGYDALVSRRPDAILVRMSGVGQEGPLSGYGTFADTLAAMSGLSSETARADGRPRGIAFGFGDMVGADHAVVAVLGALEHRARTGEGAVVDLAQLESVVSQLGGSFLERQLDTWLSGAPPVPTLGWGADDPDPNTHPCFAPHGVFRCAGDDEWCAVAVTSHDAFVRLCTLIDRPSLATDPRLASPAGRRDCAELQESIEAWTSKRSPAEAMAALQEAGVAAGAVQDGRALVEDDDQLRARGFYQTVGHPKLGDVTVEGVAVRLSETPGGVRAAAPLLGADTDEVLASLAGVAPTEIARLRADGALE